MTRQLVFALFDPPVPPSGRPRVRERRRRRGAVRSFAVELRAGRAWVCSRPCSYTLARRIAVRGALDGYRARLVSATGESSATVATPAQKEWRGLELSAGP
jgi:hypothetical protein